VTRRALIALLRAQACVSVRSSAWSGMASGGIVPGHGAPSDALCPAMTARYWIALNQSNGTHRHDGERQPVPALGRRVASCSSSLAQLGVGSRNVARSGKYDPTEIGGGKPIPGTVNGLELGEWGCDMMFLRPI
jgi:hypothetical protein